MYHFATQRMSKISLSSFYGFYNKGLQDNFKSVPFRYICYTTQSIFVILKLYIFFLFFNTETRTLGRLTKPDKKSTFNFQISDFLLKEERLNAQPHARQHANELRRINIEFVC